MGVRASRMLSALATEPCQDEAPLPQSPHAAASNIQLLTRRWALALGMSCDFGKSTPGCLAARHGRRLRGSPSGAVYLSAAGDFALWSCACPCQDGAKKEPSVKYRRMPIEVESPEEFGYDKIRYNLAESSCSDMALQDLPLRLNDLVLMYHDHRGHSGLRGLVAKEAGVQPSEVLTTVGAAAALFMVSTSLLEREDHLVVVRPNYATNIETPRAIGCQVSHLDLQFEHGWRVDLAKLESLIQPNTRFVSLTCPHNPTGVMLDEATLRGAIALCERRGIYLLCDETYREMLFGRQQLVQDLRPAGDSAGLGDDARPGAVRDAAGGQRADLYLQLDRR